jgi:hypothetical protein
MDEWSVRHAKSETDVESPLHPLSPLGLLEEFGTNRITILNSVCSNKFGLTANGVCG